ncbi:MAG: nuclease [Deltaproteobacteria bacterium]|nr:nuclease [Deltaproteobacteria bacterium]MBM4289638.1 nuclease [Deltaproteobacteria bacterium]
MQICRYRGHNNKRPGAHRARKICLAWALTLWCLTLLPGCEVAPKGPPREAAVAQVLDGDTVLLVGIDKRVRLLGIDAPEMEKDGRPAQFLAHQARAGLEKLTQGQKLRLEYDQLRYDHYDRLLAYLFLPNGALVNAEMVRQGLAHVYSIPPNTRFRDALLAAQREALEARRGIWQKALKQDEPYYLANRNSLILHRPKCPLAGKMAPANRMRLDSLKAAYLQGFSPCRSCKPGG